MIVALGPVLAPADRRCHRYAILGWRATFVVQALLALTLMLTMHRVLTESHVTRDTNVSFGDILRNYGTVECAIVSSWRSRCCSASRWRRCFVT